MYYVMYFIMYYFVNNRETWGNKNVVPFTDSGFDSSFVKGSSPDLIRVRDNFFPLAVPD